MQIIVPNRIRGLALIAAMGLMLSACEAPKPEAAATPRPLPEVGVIEISSQAVTLTTELAGRTTPYRIAEVRPQVSGIIQQRLFEEGGQIETGQVLYQIDPAMFAAAYQSAEAAVARDKASLSIAQLKVDRYKKLLASRSVSQETYDDAVATMAEARAVVAVSKAALDSARINLDYAKLTAPIGGRIGRSAVTAGALVTANQDKALATIQQLDPIYVDVNQSSAELLRLRRALASGRLQRVENLDARVSLKLEDGSLYAHKGRLQFSEVTVSASTGTVALRAVFPNPDGELLPGMYVRAVIEEGIDQQAILTPQRGVSHNSKGEATAMVLNDADQVEQRILTLDRNIGNQWLIAEGLNPGDRLIVDGLQKIKPGAAARAVSFDQQQGAAAPATH
jgi:membrane fusion protein (multidrug efflux system)